MTDLLIELLCIPLRVWVTTAVGFLAGAIAWMFLPETSDRATIGGLLVAVGFISGLVWWFVGARKDAADR